MSLSIKAIAKSLIAGVTAKTLSGYVQSRRIIAAVSSGIFLKILDLIDSFSVSEAISKETGRPVSDASTVSDNQVAEVGKNASDSSSISDLNTLDFNKIASDTSLLSDDELIDFGKNVSDSSVTSEEQTFDITKLLTDVLYATDDLDGEASIDDDQEVQFVKVTSDISNASDLAVKLAGKVTSDSAISADSGSLISQGYTVDNSYFAEDYVGESRTFT